MNDLEGTLKSLRVQLDAAQKTVARAEVKKDSARATVEKVQERLRLDFGVNSLEGGQNLLSSMENELRARIAKVKSDLEAFG